MPEERLALFHGVTTPTNLPNSGASPRIKQEADYALQRSEVRTDIRSINIYNIISVTRACLGGAWLLNSIARNKCRFGCSGDGSIVGDVLSVQVKLNEYCDIFDHRS